MRTLDASQLLRRYLVFQCVLGLLLPFACVFLVTLTLDEAWLLEAVSSLVDRGEYAPLDKIGPITTGGAYTLLQAGIAALFGPQVAAARLVIFASLLLLCLLVWKLSVTDFPTRTEAWIVLATVLSTPGVQFFGGLAYGAVLATLLLFAAIGCWDSLPRQSWSRRIATGVLLGLAAATRVNVVLCFPAWVCWLLGSKERRSIEGRDSFVALAVGTLIWAVLFLGLVSFSESHEETLSPAAATVGSTLTTAGRLLHGWPGVFKWFTGFTIGVGWLSPAMMLAWTSVLLYLDRCGRIRKRSWGLLLWFGWLEWFFWNAAAEIPHLRYLLPSLLCFFLVFGYCLGHYYSWAFGSQLPWVSQLVLGIACVSLTSANLLVIADLADGNGNRRIVEQLRWAPLSTPRVFSHIREHRGLLRYLRAAIPAGEVAAATFELAHELRFETGRRILPATYLREHGESLPRLLIYRDVESIAHEWGEDVRRVQSQLRQVASFGEIRIFERMDRSYLPAPGSPSRGTRRP